MQIQQARPPFVEFKKISKHDVAKSLEAGRRVVKDIDMAYIMQPGSRDQVEISAEQWLASIKRKMLEATADAYPQEWVDGYHKKYQLWKDGHDAPLNGTSIKEFPLLSPAEVENLIAVNILTIEDLAGATEEGLGRIGMGARTLREKAMQWVKAQSAAESELSVLREQNAKLLARIEALEEDKPKRGRKPASDQEAA